MLIYVCWLLLWIGLELWYDNLLRIFWIVNIRLLLDEEISVCFILEFCGMLGYCCLIWMEFNRIMWIMCMSVYFFLLLVGLLLFFVFGVYIRECGFLLVVYLIWIFIGSVFCYYLFIIVFCEYLFWWIYVFNMKWK